MAARILGGSGATQAKNGRKPKETGIQSGLASVWWIPSCGIHEFPRLTMDLVGRDGFLWRHTGKKFLEPPNSVRPATATTKRSQTNQDRARISNHLLPGGLNFRFTPSEQKCLLQNTDFRLLPRHSLAAAPKLPQQNSRVRLYRGISREKCRCADCVSVGPSRSRNVLPALAEHMLGRPW